jgi:hypothetical protein
LLEFSLIHRIASNILLIGVIMNKIITITCILIFGYVGNWLGGKIGVMTGYFLGVMGAMIGVYIARRIK